ncbi:unnamed protein product [Polarella glacialis]|uniref:Hexosyltransferase n=1 Tax=Polarella glacialis TaxID=89957 RepID=A0A813EUI9_POLGL|nr:unnamed protein product [Polarella glacialis]
MARLQEVNSPDDGRVLEEAWATLVSDDDAVGGQGTSQTLLVYLEVVRVMARSVRLSEQRVAEEAGVGSSFRHRPFLVLMTEAALTDEVRAILEGDGLTPLALPSFRSEGFVVPLRERQRGEVGAENPEDEDEEQAKDSPDPAMASAPEQVELSWWMKVRLWSLTQYRRIVYVDADVLAYRPLDELFALPDEVTFAAPVHPSRDFLGSELNIGIMSLRPDLQVYRAMVSFMADAAVRIKTGVRSVDQMLQHSFFARHFVWMGFPRWDPGSGHFRSCSDQLPSLHPGVDELGGDRPRKGGPDSGFSGSLGTICILPPRYDFGVSYPQLVAGMDGPEFQDELAVQFTQPGEERQPGGSWHRALRARILHWKGGRRKPWMHWFSIAKTAFDNLWWEAHAELCSSVEEARRAATQQQQQQQRQQQQQHHLPIPRPCQIRC